MNDATTPAVIPPACYVLNSPQLKALQEKELGIDEREGDR
jgi:hypothetical protein